MVLENVGGRALLEGLVILLQVAGVVGLCLSRLSAARWAERGRVGLVLALVGLGIAGAVLGRHDSEFALFAGGTMTLLLIGMTLGGGSADHHSGMPEPALVG
jgi:hypothetical protein